jgi:redox-sensitive bicupin YhaK (pirin superfamily)
MSTERPLTLRHRRPYNLAMDQKTSRRGLFFKGASFLAALTSLGATSRLLGRSKERKNMQTEPSSQPFALRAVERVLQASAPHWVGDGFLVHGVLSPDGDPRTQSPFLLLDHASRRHFGPSEKRRGVGEHPHRGFETVTFAYRGEISHRDSAGGGGIIGPGDVQWMTAASGIVHEELFSEKLSREGGELEMVQLWVNLPAKAKMSTPGYQSLLDAQFPRLALGAAEARLVAGQLAGQTGPARTHSPITVFDLKFARAGSSQFSLAKGHNALVFSLEGQLKLGAQRQELTPGALAVMKRDDDGVVQLEGAEGARALVLSGEPIDEPVAAYGPFVMNTREEIMLAMHDFQSGKMGRLR